MSLLHLRAEALTRDSGRAIDTRIDASSVTQLHLDQTVVQVFKR